MFLYFYATCVAVVLINFSASTPIPQNTPVFVCPQGYQWTSGECKQITCPSTHYLHNNACYLRTENNQPAPCPLGNSPCQAIATQPCSAGSASCQNVVNPIPVVTQPCAAGTPPCQTAVSQCSGTTAPCQTAVASTSVVTQTCVYEPCTTTCPQRPPCGPIIQPPTLPPLTPLTPPPPPPPPPTLPPPTQPPPTPEPIIRCPPGSILLNGYCHLIYCGRGIHRDGKCIQTVCPEGTVWTGSRCTIPTPQNHTTVYMTNVIQTKLNQSVVSHQINYTNNMAIYITESPVIIQTNTPPPTRRPTSPSPPPENCCTIVMPILCSWKGYGYSCKNQKVRRCGPICTNEYIYLRPPQQLPPPIPPPPPPQPCTTNNCGYEPRQFYPDCSGCRNAVESQFCSSYCERSICATRSCQPVELKGYCNSYPGSIGCRPVDGCTQDWCGGY